MWSSAKSHWCSGDNQSVRSSVPVLASGYDLEMEHFLEVASIVVTWWIVALLHSVISCFSVLPNKISRSIKGKGICLESRYPCDYTCSSGFTSPGSGRTVAYSYWSNHLWSNLGSVAPGTHYSWVDQGSVEYEVCLTLLHMTSTGNRTPDLLILSPTLYPLGHMLLYMPQIYGSTNWGMLFIQM